MLLLAQILEADEALACGFLHQFDPERMPTCRAMLRHACASSAPARHTPRACSCSTSFTLASSRAPPTAVKAVVGLEWPGGTPGTEWGPTTGPDGAPPAAGQWRLGPRAGAREPEPLPALARKGLRGPTAKTGV